MSHRLPSRLAWSLLGLTVALVAAGLALGVSRGQGWQAAGWLPVTAGFAGVGALVATRTSNKVGWLFLAVGLSEALSVALQSGYAVHAGQAPLPGARWIAWTFTMVIEAEFPLFLLGLLVFPSGHLPSARWRPVAWALVAAGVLNVTLVAVSDVNFPNTFPHLVDPLAIVPAASIRSVYNAIGGFPLAVFVAWAVSVVVRLVRSRGEERLQLTWFAYASVIAAVAVAVGTSLTNSPVAFEVFAPMIPAAAGIAILKYRLYDIDIVINKTVVYALLAAFITAVYVAIVVGIGAALEHGSTRPNVALSILATAVVAVAFQPVRDRVQRLANRLVYGVRATPYEVLSEFSARVAGTAATGEQLPRMARTLAEGTGASSATVWLGRDGDLLPAASWPVGSPAASPDHQTLSLAVLHQGEQLGAISLVKPPGERLTPAEERLTRDLASQAGLVLHNVRLTDELRARLEELRASRRRLVAAQDAARRRLERNIHDGAQQQLVALSVTTNLVRRLAGKDADKAASLVESLREDATRALRDLDELAAGLTPTALTELGLVEALRAQTGRAAVPVAVEAPDSLHVPPDETIAVYFCILEALQNVAKYAGASRALVRLARYDGGIEFEVDDDGRGFDASATSYGTGLQGIEERLASVGGTLDVRSVPGRGTTVVGRVPARTDVVDRTRAR